MIGADLQSTRLIASSSSENPGSIAYIPQQVSMETYITLRKDIISSAINLNSELSNGTYPRIRIRSVRDHHKIAFIPSDHAVSPTPPAEHLAKRAKTTSNKTRNYVRIGPSKRVRGRLSELPSMPLDILYEVRNSSTLWSVNSTNPRTVSLSRFLDIFHLQTYSRFVA